jgi:hypothetical protein
MSRYYGITQSRLKGGGDEERRREAQEGKTLSGSNWYILVIRSSPISQESIPAL